MSEVDANRVVLVLRDLGVGGAERVMVRLANFFASHGVDTHLVTLVGSGPLVRELDAGVTHHDIAAGRIRSAVLPLHRLLARLKPDALLATLPQVNAVSVLVSRLLPARPKVVLREANDPRHEAPYAKRFGSIVRLILTSAYRRADLIIAVSTGVADGVEQAYGVDRGKIVSLTNASIDDQVFAFADTPLDNDWYDALDKRVVCVARLTAQKDHETLLRAFAQLEEAATTGLVLIGTGPLETQVRSLIHELDLGDRVRLVAEETNPFRWMKRADLLVLSSRWEGSPNVLVEALALGVPVVSTDCPSGPREILAGGEYGDLVPVGDVDALRKAIQRNLCVEADGALLRRRGRDFHIERVGPLWLEALLPH